MASFGQTLSNPPPSGGGGGGASEMVGSTTWSRTASSRRDETESSSGLHALWLRAVGCHKPNTFSSDGMPSLKSWEQTLQIVQFPVQAGRQIMCFRRHGVHEQRHDHEGAACGARENVRAPRRWRIIISSHIPTETDQDGYDDSDYPVLWCINMASCPSGKIVSMRDSFLYYDCRFRRCDGCGAGFNAKCRRLLLTVTLWHRRSLMVNGLFSWYVRMKEEERHEIYILIFCCQIHDATFSQHTHPYISVHVCNA
jgi:hypothetical protein